jgi:NAD+ synthase
MSVHTSIKRDVLKIDAAQVANHITASIQTIVGRQLRRRGIVIGLSGGIDSSVVAALCARALGSDRVLGLLMPESESADESLWLGQLVADSLNIQAQIENIGPILEAAGCYQRRDSAIRLAVPEYGPGYKSKVVLANVLDSAVYQISYLVVQSLDGQQKRVRLNGEAYLSTIAANNFKQRTRKMIEYYHADRLNYAVAGTPNRLEYDQGFFVKNGDGAADIKPIAHLYKTQVYQLADFLGIPEEIRRRPPTTDTFSLPQSQEEFYFALPYHQMDLCLWAKNHGVPVAEVVDATGLGVDTIEKVFRMIDSKRRATRYLHAPPALIEPVAEICEG